MLRYVPRQSELAVLFAPPIPSSLSRVSPEGQLLQTLTVHVASATAPSQRCTGGGLGHRHSSIVAARRLVPYSFTASTGSLRVATRVPQSTVGSIRVPYPDVVTPYLVTCELSGDFSVGAEFQYKLQVPFTQFKDSQRVVCAALRRRYLCGWCSGRKKDPLHPSNRTALYYVQHLGLYCLWPLQCRGPQ